MSDDVITLDQFIFLIMSRQRSPRSRSWSVVINNPTFTLERFHAAIRENEKVAYFIGQFEKGESETLHLQALVTYKNPRTRSAIIKDDFMDRANLEPAKNVSRLSKYVSKSDTRVEGPLEFGIRPAGRGFRTDLDDLRDAIDSGVPLSGLYETHSGSLSRHMNYAKLGLQIYAKKKADETFERFCDEPGFRKKIRFIHGPARTGKTWAITKRFAPDELFRLPLGQTKNEKLWFDGYEGQKAILLDDFAGQLKLNAFLNLLDIYPLRGEVKGGFTYVNFEEVYITSNIPPEELYAMAAPGRYEAAQSRLRRQSEQIDAKCMSIDPEKLRAAEALGGFVDFQSFLD